MTLLAAERDRKAAAKKRAIRTTAAAQDDGEQLELFGGEQ